MSDDFLDKQRGYFNDFFTEFDLGETPATRYEFGSLVEFMGGDLSGKRILDLGCGNGRFGARLALATSAEVLGIDMSERAIETANSAAAKAGITRFRAVQDDFKQVRHPGEFDQVLCVNMLHHTDEQDTIARNVLATLKPGGSWIIFENNPLNPLFIPFFLMIGQLRAHLTTQYLKSNKYSLAGLASRNGFRVDEVRRYAFLPTMLYNYSSAFIGINKFLNSVPVVNELAAFHMIRATKPL
jgi:2-polyprenyl-3-methyl-5-hydroxy-6-metoxy-1,4-benzoquinol methylase